MTQPPLFGMLALVIAQAVAGHIEMKHPPPRRSQFNTHVKPEDQDYDMSSPLHDGGYACKGYPKTAAVATYRAGETIPVKLLGQADHDGGHCEFSLSYDGGKTFVVIHKIIGSCLTNDQLDYSVVVPNTAPASANVVFAWTWINKTGNREYYMNCADIAIENSAPAETTCLTGPANVVANLPECVAKYEDPKVPMELDKQGCPVKKHGCEYITEFTNSDTCDRKDLYENRPDLFMKATGLVPSCDSPAPPPSDGNDPNKPAYSTTADSNQSTTSQANYPAESSNTGASPSPPPSASETSSAPASDGAPEPQPTNTGYNPAPPAEKAPETQPTSTPATSAPPADQTSEANSVETAPEAQASSTEANPPPPVETAPEAQPTSSGAYSTPPADKAPESQPTGTEDKPAPQVDQAPELQPTSTEATPAPPSDNAPEAQPTDSAANPAPPAGNVPEAQPASTEVNPATSSGEISVAQPTSTEANAAPPSETAPEVQPTDTEVTPVPSSPDEKTEAQPGTESNPAPPAEIAPGAQPVDPASPELPSSPESSSSSPPTHSSPGAAEPQTIVLVPDHPIRKCRRKHLNH